MYISWIPSPLPIFKQLHKTPTSVRTSFPPFTWLQQQWPCTHTSNSYLFETDQNHEMKAYIIMIMIIIMIALIGTIWDFYNLLTQLRTVSNMYAQVARVQLCKSRVTHSLITCICCVPCGTRDSSATKFDRVEIAFISALCYCLIPLTDKGRKETGVPRENPWWQASENDIY